VNIETLDAIAQALDMTVDIIDQRLADMAPMRLMM
jgi:hypothetical protein